MRIQYNELDNGIILIELIGRLDIIDTGDIETKFTGYCAGENPRDRGLIRSGLPGFDWYSPAYTDCQIRCQPRQENRHSEPRSRSAGCTGNHRHPSHHSNLLSS